MLVSSGQSSAALPPIRYWGEFGYDFRLEKFESGNDLQENAGIVRLNAMTYLYQPWFAIVEGGVGFDLRRTDRDTEDTTSDHITGDGLLRLFPRSRFPFETFAERTDSRTDSDLGGLDVERTRYGFMQRYTSLGGSASRLRYEHTDLVNDTTGANNLNETRNDVADLVQASYNKNIGAHSIYFDSNLNRIDRKETSQRTETLFSSLRHTYSPGPSLTAEDMLTYNVTDLEQETSNTKTGLLQFNSFGFWRPETERPLRVNATLRVLGRENEANSESNTAQSATGTLGATYDWSPRWIFNGSTGITGINTEDDRQVSTFQALGANYNSEQFMLGGFDSSWFTQFDLRNNTDEEGSVQGAGITPGYNLRRDLFTGQNSSLMFDGSQSISFVADTDNFNSQRLLSFMSLTWNSRGTSTSRLVRLSANDSRTYASGERAAEVEGEFQLVNLQASLDKRLDMTSSLSGNLTIQATRNSRPGGFAAAGDENGEWVSTSSVDLTYFDTMVFGVPRLTFRSTLRFISDSYLPVVDTPDTMNGREEKRWENRLEYTIGRMQFRAIGQISEIQDQQQLFVLFQVRRLFGDL
ncbi:MAG: hypothetical protein ABFS24_06105 [Pseudomonadota bacterium]